ncbi:hypothetical protein [Geosporobacter ferrireducens]|uniref:Sporulation membrane protein YtrI C-terminal domain-containing protein n=1 Tax=Geosporobacter ferrireducens TaxID=1424294 RepID=A0A1D8GK37_9FIRM|nr:hypothetical protein [Geosporobacter ferrireducens]AOT71222.1 hypothetical protein Gferi_17685 [Geosporobacter ferrireducens]MTI58039.1 hypothetical protein [Geosporobacter ferrireducens]
MGRIKGKGTQLFMVFITGMILGGLIGILSISTLISYRLDQDYEKIAELQHTIEDKDTRLEKLEESINKQKIILKEIKVELLFGGNEIDEITLQKHVKEKYATLLGKEVKSIDVDLIEEIIDRRIMKVNGKEHQLLVNKIHLTDVLRIWIEVRSLE